MMHSIKPSTHIKALLLLAALALATCGEVKTRDAAQDEEKEMPEADAPVESNESLDMKANMKRLAGLTPLTDAEFAAWKPDAVLGLPATNVNTNSPEDVAMFDITYYAGGEKIRLHIVDGAGKRGSQLTGPAHMIAVQDVDEKIPMGYIKTVRENGIKARERHESANKEYQLKLFYGNRLFVTLTTLNVGRARTWQALEAFDLEALLSK